jgi:flagellar biosynthesis chaperone FliJ
MSNPLVHAFFVGRALSEAISEQAEKAFSTTLSELGKRDAELREQFRQFTDQVLERASREQEAAMQGRSGDSTSSFMQTTASSADLQTLIDELRAEVAHLRSELKHYRSSRTS